MEELLACFCHVCGFPATRRAVEFALQDLPCRQDEAGHWWPTVRPVGLTHGGCDKHPPPKTTECRTEALIEWERKHLHPSITHHVIEPARTVGKVGTLELDLDARGKNSVVRIDGVAQKMVRKVVVTAEAGKPATASLEVYLLPKPPKPADVPADEPTLKG